MVKSMKANDYEYAKIISIIETKSFKGAGTTNDPVRTVIKYWTLDGKLIAEKDTSDLRK